MEGFPFSNVKVVSTLKHPNLIETRKHFVKTSSKAVFLYLKKKKNAILYKYGENIDIKSIHSI